MTPEQRLRRLYEIVTQPDPDEPHEELCLADLEPLAPELIERVIAGLAAGAPVAPPPDRSPADPAAAPR